MASESTNYEQFFSDEIMQMSPSATLALNAKAGEMKPEDILGLTKMEKKLISSQGVLKEKFKDLMSAFSSEATGVELDTPLKAIEESSKVIKEYNYDNLSLLRYQTEEKRKHAEWLEKEIFRKEVLLKLERESLGLQRDKSSLFETRRVDPTVTGRGSTQAEPTERSWLGTALNVATMQTRFVIGLTPQAQVFFKVNRELRKAFGKHNFERAG